MQHKHIDQYEQALNLANIITEKLGLQNVETFCIFMGVLSVEDCDVTRIFNEHGITCDLVKDIICSVFEFQEKEYIEDNEHPLSSNCIKILDIADKIAANMGLTADINHIGLALLLYDPFIQGMIGKLNQELYKKLLIKMVENKCTEWKCGNQVTIE